MSSPAPGTVPLPGPPRRVRFAAPFGSYYGIGIGIGVFVTFVMGLLSLGFTRAGGMFWEDMILSKRAKPVEATPYAIEETSIKVGRSPIVRIRFRFRDASGAEQSAASLTGARSSVADKARRGETLPAEYDPEKPARARLVDTEIAAVGPWILLWYAIVLGAASTVVLSMRAVLRRRALLVSGDAATGKVVAVERTSMQVNRQHVLRIRYGFTGPFGPVEGAMKDVRAPEAGAEVTVLYDPRDPSKNLLARPGDFR